MRVDTSGSRYSQCADAETEFDRAEMQKCKTLLRRLQFLEVKVRESGGISSTNSGGAWAEYEMIALEWVLIEMGFLEVDPA